MSNQVQDVTEMYRRANIASAQFDPGKQPDIAELMRAAFRHGYAQALRDASNKGANAPRYFVDGNGKPVTGNDLIERRKRERLDSE